MNILNQSPTPININGYDTYYIESEDAIGKFLLIAIPENAGKYISDFCGSMVAGHLITQIKYEKIDGTIKFIKAYH